MLSSVTRLESEGGKELQVALSFLVLAAHRKLGGVTYGMAAKTSYLQSLKFCWPSLSSFWIVEGGRGVQRWLHSGRGQILAPVSPAQFCGCPSAEVFSEAWR